MITCLVVDDEQHAIGLLVHHIRQTPFLNLVEATTSPVKALQLLHHKNIDLVFLVVQMPDMTGIEFLQLLKGRSKVILTTAYSQYALEGFDHEVIDYLLKPISFARFMQGAQWALTFIKPSVTEEQDYILVKTEQKGKLQKINLTDIIYIEGLKNYVSFYTRSGDRIVALLNIKDLEERLPASRFVRTHKSYLVAIPFILLIEGNTIALEHTSLKIPVGETFRENFMARLKLKTIANKN